jgi:HAD superfamily hydrolase (TIGR01509 family)
MTPPAGDCRTGRAVLFDLDATLFDHRACCRAGLAAIQDDFEGVRDLPLDDLERAYNAILEEMHVRLLRGDLERAEARRLRMVQLLQAVGCCRGDADAMAGCYHRAYIAARAAVPGAALLLRALHPQAKIGIVTNNDLAEQRTKLDVCGLAHYVDVIVASRDVGWAKPDPRIFAIALERLGVARRRAVMVGDSWAADVVGARAAGIAAVWFNPCREPCPEAEVLQIHTFTPTDQAMATLLKCVRQAEGAAAV